MAITVGDAFDEFMKNYINLDPDVTKQARESRGILLNNITEIFDQEIFFKSYPPCNLHFGSFARKTKCRPLDDIDLMIGISGDGSTYSSEREWDDIVIYTSACVNSAQRECTDENGYLNSTKVLNKFKKQLSSVRDYSRSELKRNEEAITLNLISKEWAFDIVPCFLTVINNLGRLYYLIPNGKGRWKKTDPRIDRDNVIEINKKYEGKVLELIRLAKYWNRVHIKISSYLLEKLILDYCNSVATLKNNIYLNFTDGLEYIQQNIQNPVYDPKEIQGDINDLTWDERRRLCDIVSHHYTIALKALQYENNDVQAALKNWKELLGQDFPSYG